MWKECLLIVGLLFSFIIPCYANDGQVYYGTSDAGLQLFYNPNLVTKDRDYKDMKERVLTWIGAQNPKLKYVDTLFQVAFKDNPKEFAFLGTIHCKKWEDNKGNQLHR